MRADALAIRTSVQTSASTSAAIAAAPAEAGSSRSHQDELPIDSIAVHSRSPRLQLSVHFQ